MCTFIRSRPPSHPPTLRANKQRLLRGFTLIEVLMAVFVLAVALTGMMRLHLTALREQRQSSYQTTAVQLASNMAEMIRAWAAPAAGAGDPFLFDYRAGDAIPAAADCNGGARCDPAALRRFGIAQWLRTAAAALPMARIGVCRDAAPWDNSAGAFKWPCSGAGGIVIKIGWRTASGDRDRSSSSSSSSSSGSGGPQLVLNVGEPAA